MPSRKAQRERMGEILDRLKKTYPDVGSALNFSNPLELLIATILSAQCTDRRVNIVTQALFDKYTSPQHYLDVSSEELEADIFTTGFFRNKAANIRKCCRSLIDLHSGEVPSGMEDLTKLAGVGRKTANVVRGNAFGISRHRRGHARKTAVRPPRFYEKDRPRPDRVRPDEDRAGIGLDPSRASFCHPRQKDLHRPSSEMRRMRAERPLSIREVGATSESAVVLCFQRVRFRIY